MYILLFRKCEYYIKTLKSLANDPKKTEKIAMLEYIESVRTWLGMPIRDIKKRELVVCYYSEQVNSHVIDSYSMMGAHGRQRPTSMRDKGILHCMIIALMIGNFKLDIDLFATIVPGSRGLKNLSDIARIIGAVPTKDNKKIFVLKIPIPPPLSTGRKGKRK